MIDRILARLGDGIITTYVDAEECVLVRERAPEALAREDPRAPRLPALRVNDGRLADDPRTAEFLATYYGGGVHSRGTVGLGPADVVIAALRRGRRTDLCIRFIGDNQLAQFEGFTSEALPSLAATG